MIYERYYNYIVSEEGQMYLKATDAKTLYGFFSAKKYDGKNGLNAVKNSLDQDTLNIGIFYEEFPKESVEYGVSIYEAPSKELLEEYSNIH